MITYLIHRSLPYIVAATMAVSGRMAASGRVAGAGMAAAEVYPPTVPQAGGHTGTITSTHAGSQHFTIHVNAINSIY